MWEADANVVVVRIVIGLGHKGIPGLFQFLLGVGGDHTQHLRDRTQQRPDHVIERLVPLEHLGQHLRNGLVAGAHRLQHPDQGPGLREHRVPVLQQREGLDVVRAGGVEVKP